MYEYEMKLALKAARVAGEHLLKHYNTDVLSNTGKDIKLLADRESEVKIIDILKQTGYPILSEESGEVEADTYAGDLRWIIDPLDGTANYWRGMIELSCVSIALFDGAAPVLGVINRFARDQIYSGAVDSGAFMNNNPIATSKISKISDAFLSTGFPVKRNFDSDNLDVFIKQIQTFKKVRMLGSAAIMGALVAEGKVDAYMEEHIMLWDVAASAAIVMAAGGAADIKLLKNNECICTLFANDALRREYINICAQGI